MKNRILQLGLASLVAALLLAACGKEEASVVAEETPPTVEDIVDDTVAEAVATVADADEEIQVVEESAADTVADEDEEIVLAVANTPATAATYKYKEGQHYHRLMPSQPTIGGADKIEVAEFFWYGCPHCFDLEPIINRWADDVPANVRFVRVPAMWNELLQLHARLFYTEDILARNGVIKDPDGFRTAVFEEYHRRNNRLLNEQQILRLFQRFGVSQEDFNKTWNSFEVAQKLRVAADLARRYSIASVPAIVVNGKYRTGGADAGSYPKMIEVIDELIVRESAR